jgi:sugar phosphate permease
VEDNLNLGERKGLHYGWVILGLGLLCVMASVGFGRYAYTAILPGMMRGLALNYTQMGLLGTGHLGGYLLFAVVGGFLSVKYGPRLVISTSLFFLGLCLCLTGLSNSFVFALSMRFLTGLGSAAAYTPMMGLLAAWFTSEKRGMASGIISTGCSFSILLMGLLMNFLNYHFPDSGWRLAWHFIGILGIVAGVFCSFFLLNRPKDKGLKAIGRKGEMPVSILNEPQTGWQKIYQCKPLYLLAFVYFTFGFSHIIYLQYFTVYLINEMNFSSSQAGELFSLLGLLSIVSGPLWGTVSDLMGRGYGLAIVFLLQCLSFFLFALPGVGVVVGYLSTILFGLSVFSVPIIMAASAGDYLGPQLAPVGLGSITVIFGIGQAIGPAIGGRMAEISGTFKGAFFLSASLAMIGLAGSLLLGRLSKRRSQ